MSDLDLLMDLDPLSYPMPTSTPSSPTTETYGQKAAGEKPTKPWVVDVSATVLSTIPTRSNLPRPNQSGESDVRCPMRHLRSSVNSDDDPDGFYVTGYNDKFVREFSAEMALAQH